MIDMISDSRLTYRQKRKKDMTTHRYADGRLYTTYRFMTGTTEYVDLHATHADAEKFKTQKNEDAKKASLEIIWYE